MSEKKMRRDGGASPASRIEDEEINNKYYRQAKFLLETFNENRMKKQMVEDQIRKGCRFTRDDALYLIAGVKAVQYDSERVQSSFKPDNLVDKISKIDDVVERMNREACRELTQEFNKLSHRITLVNTAMTMMELDIRSVIKQRYVDGIPVDDLKSPDGHRYHYKTAMALLHKGINEFADQLMYSEAIRLQTESNDEKNEYMEELYD